eukprot:g2748.t1
MPRYQTAQTYSDTNANLPALSYDQAKGGTVDKSKIKAEINEKNKSYTYQHSCTAGSSSSDFHIFNNARRFEEERLERMKEEKEKMKAQKDLENKLKLLNDEEERKREKRRAKRKRKKQNKKAKKKIKAVAGENAISTSTSSSESKANESSSSLGKKSTVVQFKQHAEMGHEMYIDWEGFKRGVRKYGIVAPGKKVFYFYEYCAEIDH